MKRKNWLYGAIVLGMLSACTSDDVPKNNGGNQPGETGSGYMGISLQLPTEPNTRANDNFDDGTPAEYAVKNAAILLFQGDTEDAAQFFGAYTVDPTIKSESGEQITVSFNKAIELTSKPATDIQLWGLALVNYDEEDFVISQGGLTIKNSVLDSQYDLIRIGQNKEGEVPTKFSDFRKQITKVDFDFTKNGYFMTNAPLCDKPGTNNAVADGYNIQTLAKLNAKNIYSTKAQAEDKPAGCIFVERAVAKVTCSEFPKTVELKEDNDTKTKLTVSSVKWALDNEEPTSYIVRNAQKNVPSDPENLWQLSYEDKYRFVGGANMTADGFNDGNTEEHNNLYRTYWCEDPSYTGRVYHVTPNPAYKELESAFYPRENTFDLEHQNYKNTTRVVFEVTYELPNNGDDDKSLYLVDGIDNVIFNQSDAQSKLMQGVISCVALQQYLNENLKSNVTHTVTMNDFEVEYETIKNNYYKIKTLGLKEGEKLLKSKLKEDHAEFSTIAKSCIEAGNGNYNILEFEGGKCYYAAYIKHFGDDYCPYPAEDLKGSTTDAVYKTAGSWNNAKWLGRYGLVRNNWYDLGVTIIRNMGSVTPPSGNVETSDDNKEEKFFIAARVHMLSWAKRDQKHEF